MAIIGAGATGVELAAELHRTTREVVAYGLDRVDPDKDISVTLIEAADRVLPALPARLSAATEALLGKLGVHGAHQRARGRGAGRRRAAGRRPRAAGRTRGLGGRRQGAGLPEGDRRPGDQPDQPARGASRRCRRPATTTVFAIGDCAACPWLGRHRQRAAARAGRAPAGDAPGAQIGGRLAGKPLEDYRYRDFGSLVSLGEYSTVGNMMGGLIGGNLMVEGLFARLMYLSLYKMHELALHGPVKVSLDTDGATAHAADRAAR